MEEQHSKLETRISKDGENAELKHSGLGIASFTLSIISVISIFILFVTAGALDASGDMGDTASIIVGSFFLLLMIVVIISIGLGIAGLVVKNRKRVFAALGLTFSVFIFLLSIFLIIVGLYAISSAGYY
ncbi:MAG: hypothetical protein LBB59_00185 [Campylobacteraceae bacterium]|nr:hypothetical protein [Campylobacteraceae bacterium]